MGELVLVHTRRLNVLYQCMQFHSNTSIGYQDIERTQNSISNIRKENNSKIIQSRDMVLVHDKISNFI